MKPFYPTLLKPEPHPRLVDEAIRSIRGSGGYANLGREHGHAIADAAEAWLQYVEARDKQERGES